RFTDAWKYHPFHGPNNVSGIDADPEGRGLLYNQLCDDPMGRKVLALQEAYLSADLRCARCRRPKADRGVQAQQQEQHGDRMLSTPRPDGTRCRSTIAG